MALSSGLFQSQDQNEQDLTDGPGWTIDQQKPSSFENFGFSIPRGVGQGVSEGIAALAHGFQFPDHETPMQAIMAGGPSGALRAQKGDLNATPQQKEFNENLNASSDYWRSVAKTLTPDPRTTGVAANIAQGFAKAISEFGAGAAVGGPVGGAEILGLTEAHAHYHDLLDQGVDEQTARNSALLHGVTSGAGALLPMGVPAKFLAGLSVPGTILAQAGAGAVINTTFNAAARYGSAKLLESAGYPEMAKQQEPWDATNLITDAVSGLFFGAHAGWHGLKGLDAANVDPSIRDAAKVVQDRQATAERAPGIPVDMASAATHRAALEKSMADLLAGKHVELDGDALDGARFVAPEERSPEALAIIHDEFQKSGVLDFAGDFDKWLAGEREARAEVPHPKPEPVLNAEGKPVEAGQIPEALKPEGEQAEPAAHAATAIADSAVTSRPDLAIATDTGDTQPAAAALDRAREAEAQTNAEADTMFSAAINCEARHA